MGRRQRQRLNKWVGARTLALTGLGIIACHSPHALAWQVTASVRTGGTFSDNVDLSSKNQSTGFSTDVSPLVRVEQKSSRLSLLATYAPTFSYYSGPRSSTTRNVLGADATVTAIPHKLFVDASASIQQGFLSPFGPTSLDDGTKNSNRVETTTLSVSPYLKGFLRSDIEYQLRFKNITKSSNAANTFDSSQNLFSGTIAKQGGQFDWNLAHNRTATNYSARTDTREERTIATLGYRLNPTLRFFVRPGYETNNYSFNHRSTVNYGGGVQWFPSSRTSWTASMDHRYFGDAYDAAFTHRFRHAFVSLKANQGTQDFSAQSTAGRALNDTELRTLLDQYLTPKFPDKAIRDQAIQYILDRGFSYQQTYDLLLNQIVKVRTVEASTGMTGAKHEVVIRASRTETRTGLETFGLLTSGAITSANNNDRTNLSLTFTEHVTPRAAVNAILSRQLTTSNLAGDDARTTQNSLTVKVTQELASRSSVSVGVRVTRFEGNKVGSYNEHAIFAVMAHSF